MVETFFSSKITTIYSNRGGDQYQGLASSLQKHGIQHLKSPPHTPELVGVAECRHRHIVETGLTLLHYASMPLTHWSIAFQTTTYLINYLPTPMFHNQSPFHMLFRTSQSHLKLHVFGYMCYRWLRPYNTNKLQLRSRPFVFDVYSIEHNTYRCLDPQTNRIFISRHVIFVEHSFPFSKHPFKIV